MIRAALPLAFLIVAGCSQTPKQNDAEDSEPAPEAPARAVAVLSCTINGNPIGVSACMMGRRETMGGSLKISNGGSVKQYTDYDLVRENGQTFELPLTAPFEITAQSNSDQGYVLRMVIRQGQKTVFQDETTQLGVISVDSDSLEK